MLSFPYLYGALPFWILTTIGLFIIIRQLCRTFIWWLKDIEKEERIHWLVEKFPNYIKKKYLDDDIIALYFFFTGFIIIIPFMFGFFWPIGYAIILPYYGLGLFFKWFKRIHNKKSKSNLKIPDKIKIVPQNQYPQQANYISKTKFYLKPFKRKLTFG